MMLREIDNWCKDQRQTDSKIIESLEIDWPNNKEDILALMQGFRDPKYEASNPGQYKFFRSWPSPSIVANPAHYYLETSVTTRDQGFLQNNILPFHPIRLDGRTRFSLVEEKDSGDLQDPPQNSLMALFKDNEARKEVRRLVKEAFNLTLVIDPTAMQRFKIRLSSREPTDTDEEVGLGPKALKFHSEARLITEFGDGVQCFVGLLVALISLPQRIILVDEPEAFLHPPLARRLGFDLTRLASRREGTLIVGTHSADFVMGCLEASADVTILRLTYDNGIGGIRSLAGTELVNVMRDPLVRSTGVIRGLFHRGVIVTEADADRAFYDEINRRLVAEGRGVVDALFVNAQAKGTVYKLTGMLRKAGVPAAGVLDLDIITSPPGEWDNLMEACFVPDSEKIDFNRIRLQISKEFETPEIGKSAMKNRGINALVCSRRDADDLLLRLSHYGIFVVPVGELESWLSSLKIGQHGPNWLSRMFERIGSTEGHPSYVMPEKDDVWQFIDSIELWIANPNRLGL